MRELLALSIGVALFGCTSVVGVKKGTPRPDGGAGGAGAECSTHRECLAESGDANPSACVSGRCVPLLTEECPLLLPQTLWLDNLKSEGPEPVIVGVYAAMGQELSIQALNYDLAFTEFTQKVQGWPAAGGKRRPVVALACRSNIYTDQAALDRSIDHLADELEVPGILAQLPTEALASVFERSAEKHPFFVNVYGSEINDFVLPDGRLWSLLPRARDVAPTYEPLFELTVEHLRKQGKLGSKEQPRVALVVANELAVATELGDSITSTLQTAGLVADEQFRTFNVRSAALSSSGIDYSDVVQELRDFEPHVVIAAATGELLRSIAPSLEQLEPELAPTYLLSPLNYQDPALYDLNAAFPGFNERAIGVNYAAAPDQSVYDAYESRFAAAHPELNPASYSGYENHYDGAYYFLYAGVAAHGTTGADLSLGMRRLLSGDSSFAVGPDDLPAAYADLQSGESIELTGAMGPPDFNPQTGTRSTPGTVWCVKDVDDVHIDVLRLDDEGALKGDFPCFTFP